MKKLKNRWVAGITAVVIALLVGTAAMGQFPGISDSAKEQAVTKVTDKEVELFAEVNKKMMPLLEDAEKQITEAITKQKMTVERYMEIATAQRNPESKAPEVTKKESAKLEEIAKKAQIIDAKLQEKGNSVIKDKGLTPQRYDEIAVHIQSSPETQEKYTELMKSS
ncbi:MAG: DUF4168 domain-containing protein [Chitinivibrionales bacterium]